MQRKRSIDQLHDDVEIDTTSHKRPHMAERKAIDKESSDEYGRSRNETTEYTISPEKWNAYFASKKEKWNDRFSHRVYDKLEDETRASRTQYIATIHSVTGPDHLYYLCIPVAMRPERALPLDPRDCSSTVLQPISEILQKMDWKVEEEGDGCGGEEKSGVWTRFGMSLSWLMGWSGVRKTLNGSFEPKQEPSAVQDLTPEASPQQQQQQQQQYQRPTTSTGGRQHTNQTTPIDVGGRIPTGDREQKPTLSPMTVYHDEEVAKKKVNRDRAQRDLDAAEDARKYHHKG